MSADVIECFEIHARGHVEFLEVIAEDDTRTDRSAGDGPNSFPVVIDSKEAAADRLYEVIIDAMKSPKS